MILTCPSCATSYSVPEGALPATGRKVRCQSCANVWHAAPTEEPLELSAAATVEPERPEPETLAETPAPELPKAFRARAEQQRRVRRAAAHGAVWAAIASGFIGLIAAGWLFRVEVVQMAPRAASAYAMVGLPVNATGLDFEAISARTAPHDPDMVLVSGAVRNVRDAEIVTPPVRVALLDAHGAEIGHAIVRIDAAPVLPGQVQGFAGFVRDPGGKAEGVGVDFVLDETPTPEPAVLRHAPAPRQPPAAAEGLRPVIAPEAAAPHVAPVEAEPIEAQTVALDMPPEETVSASHG